MKKYYLLATALAAMVSCTSDDYVGDNNLQEANGQAAISFNMNTPAVTRAADKTGNDAATDLSNQFIVWGEKNEAGSGAEASAANLVFKNYIVQYTDGSAFKTTSNTKGWEYVGYKFDDSSASPSTEGYSTNITPNTKGEGDAVEQTIKYWDFGATSYTFTAVSALPADISDGKVVIEKKTTGTSSSDYNKGYDIEVKTGASLDNIFISDRNVINQGTGTDRTATNAYGGNATMKFRNFMSKIRFGIYETIPGYKVKITGVNYNNSTDNTTNFGVDGKFLTVGDGSTTHTKFTVTYENPSNKALVDVKSGTTPVSATYFETAPGTVSTTVTTVPFLSAEYIGTTATGATFNKTVKEGEAAAVDGVYTTIIPFSSNDTNIKLRVAYKLISEDTNEEISISEKTVEIPKEYCQWKSNYAYSYLFKITDNELYPITFDAVEVVDDNGLAEYITTVTEPSITTFAVVLDKDNKFKNYVTGKDDYQLPGGTDKLDIYATFLQDDNVLIPQLDQSAKANYVKVYYVTASDPNDITELSVANAVEHPGGLITATEITSSNVSTYLTSVPAPVSSVPGEDGVNKTINALKLTGVKNAGKYAVEIITYEKLATKLTSDQSKVGYYSLSGDTYAKETEGNGNGSTDYYKQIKTYKVITVAE